MSNLERLYYNMGKLVDDWTDGAAIRAASDRLERALGDELYTKYEDEICNCTSENHKDGFIKGFEYAVSLFATGKAVRYDRTY